MICIYRLFFKRMFDVGLSIFAILFCAPVFLLLTIFGTIAFKGNPLFFQQRVGKDEKVFVMIKFRTMRNANDYNGNLLPSEKRITKYGKILRLSSLDELPEFFNILKGDMSIVGPRPLLVDYLSLYNTEQKHRHDVRPGLTGYAQVNGRNSISWEEKFKMDVWYTQNVCFKTDIIIFFKTIISIFRFSNVEGKEKATMERFNGSN